MTKPRVTLVIPLYNEADAVSPLILELSTLRLSRYIIDVIFVNDGSSDSTLQTIKLQKPKFEYTIITLSRNFGHQAALLAGLETATGDIVVTMDGDLQHPVSLIPEMVKKHEEGIDIVLTQRIDEDDLGVVKKGTSKFFYWLVNALSTQKITQSSSDFRSMNRRALTALLALPEKRKFLRGLVGWIGYSQIVLPFQSEHRVAGASKYTWRKMVSLAGAGITSFTTAPLYFSAIMGLALFIAAVLYALYVIYVRFVSGAVVEGWASVLFVLLVIGGSICLFLGLIGIYLAAIYDEVKNRPTHIIAERFSNTSKQ